MFFYVGMFTHSLVLIAVRTDEKIVHYPTTSVATYNFYFHYTVMYVLPPQYPMTMRQEVGPVQYYPYKLRN